MFEKFLQTPECMRVLTWFLRHPDDFYSASIVAIECDIVDMSSYMAVLSTLEGVKLIETDELSKEDLMLRLNKESSSTQLLTHFRDEFNDNAFHSDQVAPSLAYLNSNTLKNSIDAHIFDKYTAEEIVDMCKNYETLDTSDLTQNELFQICSRLKESGEYDEFIQKLEYEIEK